VSLAAIWVLLASSFVIGLAAVVRMGAPADAGRDAIAGMIRLPHAMTATVVTIFALAAVVLFTDLLRRAMARQRDADDEGALGPEPPRMPAWLRTLTQILSFVYVAIVVYLLWKGAIPLAGMIAQQGAGAVAGQGASPGSFAPPLVTYTFGALALAVALATLAVALWVAFGERLASWWTREEAEAPSEPLAAAVEESLEDLRAEADPRRAIIRCYARFERVATASGLARKPWFTPMEFTREALARLPVPRAAVPVLTGLFELARFSHHPLGMSERDRALAALDEIRLSMETRDADAG
jgi:hypothetical protein